MALIKTEPVSSRKQAALGVLAELEGGGRGRVEALKRKHSRLQGLESMLKNSELIAECSDAVLRRALRKGAVRSASGICVIAVMTRPGGCPYDCAYCPTSGIAAKSYTGFEPAALRARQNDFDAGRQVSSRLRQLEAAGHDPQKCELVVMGGTFNAQPEAYQQEFLKSALEAFNGKKARSWEAAMKANETCRHRVIGITFETRPDCAMTPAQVSSLVDRGATRIELGAQSLDDNVLRKVNRGHGVAETAAATAACKDAFLKVGYHVMPGLFATPAKDERMFKQMFSDERFKPDMLKIYPALVMEGTRLWEWWKEGKFKPYSTEEAAVAVARMLRHTPAYVRVMRVDRDIPSNRIAAGVKKTNLRELVQEEMDRNGWECRDIRAREVGLRGALPGSVEMNELEYDASGGKEVFISLDAKDGGLAGYLRLRKPFAPFRREITAGAAGVRELRVLGELVGIGERSAAAFQHKSYGSELLGRAEEIARKWGCGKLCVTSGVGCRQYYHRKGFQADGAYVSKNV